VNSWCTNRLSCRFQNRFQICRSKGDNEEHDVVKLIDRVVSGNI
jgi:hypothetical protein